MPRQRFIWPSIWTDPVLGRLKPEELLLYVACFSNADDEGKLLGEPAFLRATVFPYQDFGKARMRRMRDALIQKQNSLRLYVVDGIEYLRFENWTEWQKPKYPSPSKLPDPIESFLPDSGNGSGNGSPNPPEAFPEASRDPDLRVGLGRDGLGESSKEDLSGSAARNPDDLALMKRVMTYANTTLGHRWKLIDVRKTKLRARLREGYTEADLCKAIDGVLLDPWEGRTLSGNDDPKVIFRDGSQVDKFLGFLAKPPVLNGHKETDAQKAAREKAHTDQIEAMRREKGWI